MVLLHRLINQVEPKPKIRPLSELVVDYTPDNIKVKYTTSLEITILFNTPHGGSRWRTIMKSGHGLYTAKICTPAGNASGLVSSFYLSTGQEGDDLQQQQQQQQDDEDEIDFEFLGLDARLVQTNVHVKGIGNREAVHELGFDASAAFHEYSIFWSAESIEWFVDGARVRIVSRKKSVEGGFDPEWPTRPMYLYASVWNAESIASGRWAGLYVGCDEPYACRYEDVFIPAWAQLAL